MKHHTSTKTRTVITGPTIPQDIVNEIADHLVIDSDFLSIRACALLSKSSVQPCRRHLFRVAVFTPASVDKWFKTFPAPEESPAHHVKDLRIWIGGGGCVPEKFFKYTQWFPNTESMSLLGRGGVPLMRRTSLWRFPKSVTSLTIDTDVVTLLQVRDIMAHLPNLDDLSLSGSLVATGRRELLGIGRVLRGRFGGKLVLSDEYVDEDVINMLLEIPSGLRFTEAQVHCTHDILPSAVRFVESCGETLVKLSHTFALHRKFCSFSSFGPRKSPLIRFQIQIKMVLRFLSGRSTFPNSRTLKKWTLSSFWRGEVHPGSLWFSQRLNPPPLRDYPLSDSNSPASPPWPTP